MWVLMLPALVLEPERALATAHQSFENIAMGMNKSEINREYF